MPTYGGTTINVVGTGFAAGVNSATLGGKPLTDINVVDDTLFTATTPANPAGNAALTVSTVGGTDTTLSSATNHYVYVDSIQVSPTTGVGGTVVPLSVQGYGFNNKTFTTSTGANTLSDEAKTHVYLVNTAVGATLGNDPANNTGKKTKAQVNECHQHPGHQRHRAGLHARPQPEDGRCSGDQRQPGRGSDRGRHVPDHDGGRRWDRRLRRPAGVGRRGLHGGSVLIHLNTAPPDPPAPTGGPGPRGPGRRPFARPRPASSPDAAVPRRRAEPDG